MATLELLRQAINLWFQMRKRLARHFRADGAASWDDHGRQSRLHPQN
jgi:hypothetical protein